MDYSDLDECGIWHQIRRVCDANPNDPWLGQDLGNLEAKLTPQLLIRPIPEAFLLCVWAWLVWVDQHTGAQQRCLFTSLLVTGALSHSVPIKIKRLSFQVRLNEHINNRQHIWSHRQWFGERSLCCADKHGWDHLHLLGPSWLQLAVEDEMKGSSLT